MTLVVGKIDKKSNNFSILSDTRITDIVKKDHSKIFEGVVKSLVYSPEICISIAGSNISGDEILNSIFQTSSKLNIQPLIKLLYNFHLSRNKDIEFLISNIQFKAICFCKISQGKVDFSDTSAWIGDINGFNFFQKEFHKISKDKNKDRILDNSEEAFKNTLISNKIPTVGGIPVIIHRTQYGFQYITQSTSILGRDSKIEFENKKSVPLDFGSAKEGSFNYSYLTSKNPRTPALGIHYYDGNFGIFSYPQKSRYFQVYKNVDINKFVDSVKEEHNIIIGGIISERGTMRFI